jgi:hypothetical protein
MPVHDWTRVDACIFHDFHISWTGCLRTALNEGLLPSRYYALVEQHAGRTITDVLTLGGQQPVELPALARRRTVAIRHVTGHRLIALVEIVSPATKDRARHVDEFAVKAVDALDLGIHVLLVDLFPPGLHDPYGMYAVVRQHLEQFEQTYDLASNESLTLTSFAAGQRVEIYLEQLAVGAALPDMPLFLRADRYVNVPLETTYQAAYRGCPAFWRDVLEGRPPPVFGTE